MASKLHEGYCRLSHEQLFKTLRGLGLAEIDAEIYLFLSKEGPQKGRNIGEALKLYKQQLYHSLKNLQRKGCVKATHEHPSRFSAVPIEEALSSFIKANLEEAQHIEENRKKTLSFWQAMMKENTRHRE